MKKSGRSKSFSARELAQMMLWSLFAILSGLGYLTQVRPYLLSNFGLYIVGLLDGIVGTLAIIVLIFYLASKA